MLKMLCVVAFSVAVLGGRYLLFEYNHGDREVVLHLLDTLVP